MLNNLKEIKQNSLIFFIFKIYLLHFIKVWQSMKKKITISISDLLLDQIDKKNDWKNQKNRSSIIENLILKWLNLKDDIWVLILAHENNWDDWSYPLNIPKVLIKIDWKTILEKYLEYLKVLNVNKIVISIWYQKEQIKNFLKNKNYWIDIKFLEVDKNSLSLDILSKAKEILNSNKVLTILWDNYFYPLNLLDFVSYHNNNNADISIIIKTINDSSNYWNVEIVWNNIVSFIEKPFIIEKKSFLINTWVYLINSEFIPEKSQNLKIELDFFPDFAKTKKIKAYFYNWKYFHLQNNQTLKLLTK